MGFANFDSAKVASVLEKVDNNERKMYFEGMGINLQNVNSLETALKLSKMDFKVEKLPIQFVTKSVQEWNGKQILVDAPHNIPDMFATVRTDTMDSLGVVGKNYEILQNTEGFDFLDSLVMEGAKFETASTYGPRGAKSFICMSTEPLNILGDEFKGFINFFNSFDGSGCVRVMFCPVRLFCSNAITRSLKCATNKIAIRHSSNLQGRLDAARQVLLQNTNYLTALNEEAEKLAVKPFSRDAFEALAKRLFPVNTEDKDIIQIRNLAQIEQMLKAYDQQDLANFNNTAWGAIQAASDVASHPMSWRNTKTPASFTAVINELPLLEAVWSAVEEAA